MYIFIPIKAFNPTLGTKQITAVGRVQHAIWRRNQRITSKNYINIRKDLYFRPSSVFGVVEIGKRKMIIKINLIYSGHALSCTALSLASLQACHINKGKKNISNKRDRVKNPNRQEAD